MNKYTMYLILGVMAIMFCSNAYASDAHSKKAQSQTAEGLERCREFIKDNIAALNEIYSKEYQHTRDMELDTGEVIQDLIDIKTAHLIVDELKIDSWPIDKKIEALLTYVHAEYNFVFDPYSWPSVKETIQFKTGDCNDLSILLMSLLLAAEISEEHVYLGFSNSHMWVVVYCAREWYVLETDQDPARASIYNLPGFYDYPVFKIFTTYTAKRVREVQHEQIT